MICGDPTILQVQSRVGASRTLLNVDISVVLLRSHSKLSGFILLLTIDQV